jgi:1-acyl-sn-glycerol-3-phosphate acyltransferase
MSLQPGEVSGPTRVDLVLYAVVRGLVHGFARLLWRVRIEGREKLPATGSYVLAPVHRSNVDTIVAACVTTRRLRFMGKHTMWKWRLPGRFFTALGGFPVRRGTADRDALRMCVEVIRTGEPLVLFPEGTRREGPVVEDLFDGAAYLAARTGVPIVPVGIGGSASAMPRGAKFVHPARIRVVVGDPLVPEAPSDGGRVPRRAVRELTERLEKELQRLFDEAEAKSRSG